MLNEKFTGLSRDEYTLKLKRMMIERLTKQYELAIKGGGDEKIVMDQVQEAIEHYKDAIQMIEEADLCLYGKEGKPTHKILKTIFRSIFLWVMVFSLFFLISIVFEIWSISWILFLFGVVLQCYIIFRLFTPKL